MTNGESAGVWSRSTRKEMVMNIGMLWFDGDPSKSLPSRVERATSYYQAKYGRQPNTCVLHPKTLGEVDPNSITDVRVETSMKVLPEHFWVGYDDKSRFRMTTES